MAVQEVEDDAALQLEVALALLPLIGRCAELNGGGSVRQRGPRLEAEDRRTLVREVARCWRGLKPDDRRLSGRERPAAIAEFAANYVDDVEASEPDKGDEQSYGYDAAMEIAWRRHAELIRLREATDRL